MLSPKWIISDSRATKSALLNTGHGKRRGFAYRHHSFSRRHTSVEALKPQTIARTIFPAIATGICDECKYSRAAAEDVSVRHVHFSCPTTCDVGAARSSSR